jgi:hypothetical protein
MRHLIMPLFVCVASTACPTTDTTTSTSTSGKSVKLTVPGFDYAIDLPDDGAGTWALVEGGGKADGAFGRTTSAGTHATTLTQLSASSCDAALAGAKQSASGQGKTLNALDRPQWLPSRYWPIGLEAFDGDPSGATPGTAVWLACLDTKRGPLGALTTVTAAAGGAHTAAAPHVKTALDRVADAALAAAMTTSPPPPPPG